MQQPAFGDVAIEPAITSLVANSAVDGHLE